MGLDSVFALIRILIRLLLYTKKFPRRIPLRIFSASSRIGSLLEIARRIGGNKRFKNKNWRWTIKKRFKRNIILICQDKKEKPYTRNRKEKFVFEENTCLCTLQRITVYITYTYVVAPESWVENGTTRRCITRPSRAFYMLLDPRQNVYTHFIRTITIVIYYSCCPTVFTIILTMLVIRVI